MIQRRSGKKLNTLVEILVLPLCLFVVALLPRLMELDVFLTPDEYRWVGRSRDFLDGILSGDWAATLQAGHPGVTTMWTGSLGILYNYLTRPPSAPDDLLTFVQQVSNEPIGISYVVPVRFPTALLMALFVVAFYILIRRLFDDWRIGAFAALLLALNPFHIALSRVLHHDALASMFMTLSLLPLLGYWLGRWSKHWLFLSGIAAGMAILTESPAMFLMPFCALLGLIWAAKRWRKGEWQGWSDVRRLVGDGLMWGVVAWLTVFLLWPAMWVIPLEVMRSVLGIGAQYASEGHGKGNFFLGKISRDPGSLFYPLSWLLRTTPLTLLGLSAWAGFFLHSLLRRRTALAYKANLYSAMLLLYVGLFVVFMTLPAKKQDRYILPIYPILGAVAAVGLVRIVSFQFDVANSRLRFGKRLAWLLVIAAVILQAWLVVVNRPYYFTYYNPLVGGAPMAARLMTVGWGEGLDQAATYLNDLPDAEQLQVTAWYDNSFATFFRGHSDNFVSDPGPTWSSDYVVVYINQIQRELPTAGLVHYFVEHQTPVFTAAMQRLDYVYVYALPTDRPSDWKVDRLPGQATFLGVSDPGFGDETKQDIDNSSLSLRLHWQNEGLAASDDWWIALEPINGPLQPWQRCSLSPDFADEQLTVGAWLESECQLVAERSPPDVYHLRVGVGPDSDQITVIPFSEGEFAVAVQDDGLLHVVSRLTALDVLARHLLPQGARPVDLVYYGAVRLIGYTTEIISTDEGRQLHVHANWQALEPLPLAELDQAVILESALIAPRDVVLAVTQGPFGDSETWPAVWSPGQVLTTTSSLPVPDSIPSESQLRLNVVLNGQRRNPLNSRGEAAESHLPVFVVQ